MIDPEIFQYYKKTLITYLLPEDKGEIITREIRNLECDLSVPKYSNIHLLHFPDLILDNLNIR